MDASELSTTIDRYRATSCYRDDARGSLIPETKRPGNGDTLERKVTKQPASEEGGVVSPEEYEKNYREKYRK